MARLSIRLHPSQAIDAFDHAASELVDKHPDVYAAKLAGPPEIHLRPDSLILYLTKRNIESAKSIVQDFAVRFPDHFSNSALDDVPVGMYKLTSNTGYAEQFGRQSHGRALAHAIDSALQKYDDYASRNKETKSEELLRRFDEEFLPSSFREHGIDPDAPYRNFPGPESSS